MINKTIHNKIPKSIKFNAKIFTSLLRKIKSMLKNNYQYFRAILLLINLTSINRFLAEKPSPRATTRAFKIKIAGIQTWTRARARARVIHARGISPFGPADSPIRSSGAELEIRKGDPSASGSRRERERAPPPRACGSRSLRSWTARARARARSGYKELTLAVRRGRINPCRARHER